MFATHVQIDELSASKPERAAALLKEFERIQPNHVATASATWDVSKWDDASWTEGSLCQKITNRLRELDAKTGKTHRDPHNTARDALIADTAIKGGFILISGDRNLRHVVEEFGWPGHRRRFDSRKCPERNDIRSMIGRRFPPPWTFEEANNACFIVKDHNGQVLAFVYFEGEPGRRTAAKLLTRDEARRVAANIAKIPTSRRKQAANNKERIPAGALDLTDPWHLFEKLDREAEQLKEFPEDMDDTPSTLGVAQCFFHGRSFPSNILIKIRSGVFLVI